MFKSFATTLAPYFQRLGIGIASRNTSHAETCLPDNLFEQHIKAMEAFQHGLFLEAGQILEETLAKDPVYVEGPLSCYKSIFKSDGNAKADAYLQLFIDKRNQKTWKDIDTYVDHLRTTRYLECPLAVNIETLALCNAACNFCQYVEIDRIGDRMPDSLVNKIIDELAEIPSDLPFTITLAGVSEPLLDNRIYDHIEKINEKIPHAYVAMNTNGAPLTEKNLDRLCKLKIAWMGISVNDYRKKEYEESMKIPYDRTIAVLNRLQEDRHSGKIPFNVGVTRAGDGSIHDLRFIEWTQKKFPDLSRNFSPQFSWVGDAPTTLAPPIGCTHWFDITVRSTGQVAFCCIDGHIQAPRGDLKHQHILEVYNSPDYRALRTAKKIRSEVDYCKSCTSG